ncbi:jg27053 [Pararge aegeria aegeria]|uniref:Jg27053 protein n=1 Tax=Pararge aegeria aegeria TaxID=348720 RepID=A0A8S4SB23_9NEOP|nr:jg27053 [Pararge aegeria aegeria]
MRVHVATCQPHRRVLEPVYGAERAGATQPRAALQKTSMGSPTRARAPELSASRCHTSLIHFFSSSFEDHQKDRVCSRSIFADITALT